MLKASDCTPDTVNGNQSYLRNVYNIAYPGFDGKATVPLLWDKKRSTIVNNESAEILRILNADLNDCIEDDEARKLDLYPEHLREEIDQLNSWILPY